MVGGHRARRGDDDRAVRDEAAGADVDLAAKSPRATHSERGRRRAGAASAQGVHPAEAPPGVGPRGTWARVRATAWNSCGRDLRLRLLVEQCGDQGVAQVRRAARRPGPRTPARTGAAAASTSPPPSAPCARWMPSSVLDDRAEPDPRRARAGARRARCRRSTAGSRPTSRSAGEVLAGGVEHPLAVADGRLERAVEVADRRADRRGRRRLPRRKTWMQVGRAASSGSPTRAPRRRRPARCRHAGAWMPPRDPPRCR